MFHRHTWASIAVEKLVYSHFRTGVLGPKDWAGRPLQIGPDEPITEVLQRCECGKIRTITLDGHWTIEQVKAK